jgi:CIC family chloride channel protein
VVLLAKTLTTGLTITTGGSAGVLIPSMVLGGLAGTLTAQLRAVAGVEGLDPPLFTVVGIASALVAVVGVPLAAIALVFEAFGRAYGPPAILACGLTYFMTLRFKVYQAQRIDESAANMREVPVTAPDTDATRPETRRSRP